MDTNSRERELWKELDRLAFWLSLIGTGVLTASYFLVAALLDQGSLVREFLLGVLTNLIPVVLLFALSYVLIRRMQIMRAKLDAEDLASLVARKINENFGGEGTLASRSNQTGSQSHGLTILFLTARPEGTVPLQVEEELRGIRDGLRSSLASSTFILKQELGLRRNELQDYLIRYKPAIVHFSGHTGEEGIILEGGAGQMSVLYSQELHKLFAVFRDIVRLVILNGSHTKASCEMLAQDIDYAIGVEGDLADESAVEFSMAFYNALGNGYDVELAFELGCARIAGSTTKYILFKSRRRASGGFLSTAHRRDLSS